MVSTDFIHDKRSSIVDVHAGISLNSKFVKVSKSRDRLIYGLAQPAVDTLCIEKDILHLETPSIILAQGYTVHHSWQCKKQ